MKDLTAPPRTNGTRRRAAAVLGALAGAFALAGSAQGATVIGQVFLPDELYQVNFTVIQSGSPGGQYTVPSDGVITAWSFHASATAVPQGLMLKVARPGAGVSFTTIGESAPKTLNPGQLNTFTDIAIPVKAGDVLGLYSGSADLVALYRDVPPAAGYVSFDKEVDAPLNAPLPFDGPYDDAQLDVSATVEPDCDNDGLGDETQDTVLAGGACPTALARALTLDANRNLVKRGKRVQLSGRLDAPGDLSACESAQAIEIERKVRGESSFEQVGQATSAGDGAFSLRVKVKKRATFRANVTEQGQCGAGTSDTEKIGIKPPK